jgi:hypothetical protein
MALPLTLVRFEQLGISKADQGYSPTGGFYQIPLTEEALEKN